MKGYRLIRGGAVRLGEGVLFLFEYLRFEPCPASERSLNPPPFPHEAED